MLASLEDPLPVSFNCPLRRIHDLRVPKFKPRFSRGRYDSVFIRSCDGSWRSGVVNPLKSFRVITACRRLEISELRMDSSSPCERRTLTNVPSQIWVLIPVLE
jgi:hypothetical protein